MIYFNGVEVTLRQWFALNTLLLGLHVFLSFVASFGEVRWTVAFGLWASGLGAVLCYTLALRVLPEPAGILAADTYIVLVAYVMLLPAAWIVRILGPGDNETVVGGLQILRHLFLGG